MDNIYKIVLIVHALIALLIITLVLLQRGKGADAGAAFGAGASGTVFGARGSSSFFSRATALLATAFFVSSLSLAYLSSQATSGPESLLDDAPAVEQAVDDAIDLPAVGEAALEDAADAVDAEELPTLDDVPAED
jgi:preprotein translocase subunit SecG